MTTIDSNMLALKKIDTNVFVRGAAGFEPRAQCYFANLPVSFITAFLWGAVRNIPLL